jgi:DNA-binding NarL/FixJ family response regulator
MSAVVRNPTTSSEQAALVIDPDRAAARQTQSCLMSAGFLVPRPFATAREAVLAAAHSSPDVIVMDIAATSDADASRELFDLALGHGTPIVCLLAAPDRETLERAADCHAAACVVKPYTERQLACAVLFAAIQAQRALPVEHSRRMTTEEKLRAIAAVVNDLPAVEEQLLTRPARMQPMAASGPVDPLSARERQIVDLLANGARVVTIARRLQLSPHTVRNHLKSVFRKLNVHGQHELFEYWHQHA